jgi:legumain
LVFAVLVASSSGFLFRKTTAAQPARTTAQAPAKTTQGPGGKTTQGPGGKTTQSAKGGKQWALLVAGSNYYSNYRHQSDICHAYQILHAHGIPDENIVVMMYDDIANNKQNPTPGVIVNHVDGPDVYKGVPKDYTGKDVTPQNFINILTGKKDAVKNIGSGKVIESTSNDHVFVYFADHGATNLVAFPDGELTKKQLNDALKTLYDEKRYSQLVIYIEACEAGSMFRGVLPNNTNVFATTASDYDESSYATYYDEKRKTYLGDEYSVNWMEDSDAQDIEKETLQTQFQNVKDKTKESHAQEYGDLTIGKIIVGEFQGRENAPAKKLPKYKGTKTPSLEVPLDLLHRALADAKTPQQKKEIQAQIDSMLEKRAHLETVYKKLVSRVSDSHHKFNHFFSTTPQDLKELDCQHDLVKAFSKHCFNFGTNPYALKHAYILTNFCQAGLNVEEVIGHMKDICSQKTIEGIVE